MAPGTRYRYLAELWLAAPPRKRIKGTTRHFELMLRQYRGNDRRVQYGKSQTPYDGGHCFAGEVDQARREAQDAVCADTRFSYAAADGDGVKLTCDARRDERTHMAR